MLEPIDQPDDIIQSRRVWAGASTSFQQFDFVNCSFSVVFGRFYNFKGDMLASLCVFSQPDGREMTPSQLSHDNITRCD